MLFKICPHLSCNVFFSPSKDIDENSRIFFSFLMLIPSVHSSGCSSCSFMFTLLGFSSIWWILVNNWQLMCVLAAVSSSSLGLSLAWWFCESVMLLLERVWGVSKAEWHTVHFNNYVFKYFRRAVLWYSAIAWYCGIPLSFSLLLFSYLVPLIFFSSFLFSRYLLPSLPVFLSSLDVCVPSVCSSVLTPDCSHETDPGRNSLLYIETASQTLPGWQNLPSPHFCSGVGGKVFPAGLIPRCP